jgi:hypothetical protein
MRCNTDIFPYSSMQRITFRVNILCIMFNIIAFFCDNAVRPVICESRLTFYLHVDSTCMIRIIPLKGEVWVIISQLILFLDLTVYMCNTTCVL